MADVNNSRLIQLDHYIPSDWYTLITDPNRADHASNVFFHILPKKGKLNGTYQKLKTVPHLYTYLKEEIPEEFHYRHNRRVMPIFIVAEEVWTITKNKSRIDSRGNHGYSNQFPDMHPFFLAQGPAFKEGFVSEPFENVNIYSLLCHLQGIKPDVDSSQCNFCFSSFVNELCYCLTLCQMQSYSENMIYCEAIQYFGSF